MSSATTVNQICQQEESSPEKTKEKSAESSETDSYTRSIREDDGENVDAMIR